MEEQEPFLTLPSPTKLSKNVTQQQSGRITGTLIVLFLSFVSVIPQTIVAIETRSMALLADSLCMWSDSASYLACVAVFYLLKQQRHRAKYGTLFDFIGALIGLILLVASAAYITSESMEILMKLGTKTKEVDGKWGVINELLVDAVLVATGRLPNVTGMGLEEAGVEYDGRIGVKVNDRLQTSNSKIFAAGDCCSTFKFTHGKCCVRWIVRCLCIPNSLLCPCLLSQLPISWHAL